MLYPNAVISEVSSIRLQVPDMPVYMYTALLSSPLKLLSVARNLTGLTVTLHEQSDVEDVEKFTNALSTVHFSAHISLRLHVFDGIDISMLSQETLDCWRVKRIKWLDECPLPANEVLGRKRFI